MKIYILSLLALSCTLTQSASLTTKIEKSNKTKLEKSKHLSLKKEDSKLQYSKVSSKKFKEDQKNFKLVDTSDLIEANRTKKSCKIVNIQGSPTKVCVEIGGSPQAVNLCDDDNLVDYFNQRSGKNPAHMNQGTLSSQPAANILHPSSNPLGSSGLQVPTFSSNNYGQPRSSDLPSLTLPQQADSNLRQNPSSHPVADSNSQVPILLPNINGQPQSARSYRPTANQDQTPSNGLGENQPNLILSNLPLQNVPNGGQIPFLNSGADSNSQLPILLPNINGQPQSARSYTPTGDQGQAQLNGLGQNQPNLVLSNLPLQNVPNGGQIPSLNSVADSDSPLHMLLPNINGQPQSAMSYTPTGDQGQPQLNGLGQNQPNLVLSNFPLQNVPNGGQIPSLNSAADSDSPLRMLLPNINGQLQSARSYIPTANQGQAPSTGLGENQPNLVLSNLPLQNVPNGGQIPSLNSVADSDSPLRMLLPNINGKPQSAMSYTPTGDQGQPQLTGLGQNQPILILPQSARSFSPNGDLVQPQSTGMGQNQPNFVHSNLPLQNVPNGEQTISSNLDADFNSQLPILLPNINGQPQSARSYIPTANQGQAPSTGLGENQPNLILSNYPSQTITNPGQSQYYAGQFDSPYVSPTFRGQIPPNLGTVGTPSYPSDLQFGSVPVSGPSSSALPESNNPSGLLASPGNGLSGSPRSFSLSSFPAGLKSPVYSSCYCPSSLGGNASPGVSQPFLHSNLPLVISGSRTDSIWNLVMRLAQNMMNTAPNSQFLRPQGFWGQHGLEYPSRSGCVIFPSFIPRSGARSSESSETSAQSAATNPEASVQEMSVAANIPKLTNSTENNNPIISNSIQK